MVRNLFPKPSSSPFSTASSGCSDAKHPGLKGDLHAKVLELARCDRTALGKVYDAMRKLQPFWALAGSDALGNAAAELLASQTLGIAFRGAGIRLDLPDEDKWRSPWHQEYPSQMSSPRGVVAWFPSFPSPPRWGR